VRSARPTLPGTWLAFAIALAASGCGARTPDGEAARRAATTPKGATLVDIPEAEFNYPEYAGFPSRTVRLPAFRIEATEVTVAAYRACVEAGVCKAPPKGGGPAEIAKDPIPATCNWDQPGRDDHPINCLLVAEADAYCAWNHGRRLPSIFELYWAGLGSRRVSEEQRLDGRKMPLYVWGRAEPEEKKLCWQRGRFAGTRGGVLGPIEEVKPPVAADLGTCAVASSPDDVSAFGVFDLAANVVEIGEDPRERSCWSKERGDHPCPRERRMVSSGGSWAAVGLMGNLSSKSAPHLVERRSEFFGFRCVEGPPPETALR
jgi:formylglycine-generating enzyme required for sulfatase activity